MAHNQNILYSEYIETLSGGFGLAKTPVCLTCQHDTQCVILTDKQHTRNQLYDLTVQK